MVDNGSTGIGRPTDDDSVHMAQVRRDDYHVARWAYSPPATSNKGPARPGPYATLVLIRWLAILCA